MVTARAPRGTTPRLFAEGPPDWFLADAAPAQLAPKGDSDVGTYRLRILERPRTVPGSVELRLTLVAGNGSIETTALLDSAPLLR